VTLCVQNFVTHEQTFDEVIVKILKIWIDLKFADPKTAANSPYFKRSMAAMVLHSPSTFITAQSES